MNLVRNYKFRIFPTKKQEKQLQFILDECRWVYNKTLEFRKTAYEIDKKNIGLYDTHKQLLVWKEERNFLKEIHSQVLQNVCARVDLAFKGFFRRIKKGDTPGYPRFKGRDRYDSFTYPQYGFSITDEKRIKLSSIGCIKSKIHRPIKGTLKTCCVKKSPTNKWYCVFSVEITKKKPRKTGKKSVGIDLGLKTFATFSDNSVIENPKFFKHEQKELAKVQRKKNKKIIARVHEKITNKRHNFSHQQSNKIVDKYDIICLEDLKIQKMQKDNYHSMNCNISDVAWNQFVNNISYKAEEAGKKCILVDPKNTSQGCSRCGGLVGKSLDVRIHKCPHCNLHIDRDLNASLNILRLGLQSLAKSLEAHEFIRENSHQTKFLR